jgi:flagellar assembly protein FliH
MILQFDEGVSTSHAEALPLEFESLDQPDEILDSAYGAEVEAALREKVAALEAKLAEEAQVARQQIETARRETERETRERMTAEMERRIAAERATVTALMEEFAGKRTHYFAEVECEVVSLSLAIAAQVLHREVLLDPMLLRATVRVALDKVAGESSVSLRVPEAQAEAWRGVLSTKPGAEAVVVIGDSHMRPDEAVLETGVGRVELGVAEQLKEIERGFFDLLATRPS